MLRQAARVPRSFRWRPLGDCLRNGVCGHVGVSLNVDMLILDPNHESDYGDGQGLGEADQRRREDRAIRALFAEELGGVIKCLWRIAMPC